nr:endonuclease domain-containing protein [Caulobacter sp. NIBR1757]
MSLPEVLLWQALRRCKVESIRFRRQQPIGPYVADFYCGARRLVIEIDGQSHYFGDRPDRDEARDAWLVGQGFRVLRLPASLVLRDMDSAVMTILAAVDDRQNPPPGREASRGRGTTGPT